MTDMKPYPASGGTSVRQLRAKAETMRKRADQLRRQLAAAQESFGRAFAKADATQDVQARIANTARRPRRTNSEVI